MLLFLLVLYYTNETLSIEEQADDAVGNDGGKSTSTNKAKKTPIDKHVIHLKVLQMIALCAFLLLLGWAFMLLLAYSVRSNEKCFSASFSVFIVYTCCLQLAIFLSIMKSVKVEYGDEFHRKIFYEKHSGPDPVQWDDSEQRFKLAIPN